MRLLGRWTSAVAVMCVTAGCGITTAEQIVPDPQTPAQKATASPANPDSATLADFNARLERILRDVDANIIVDWIPHAIR